MPSRKERTKIVGRILHAENRCDWTRLQTDAAADGLINWAVSIAIGEGLSPVARPAAGVWESIRERLLGENKDHVFG